MKVGDLIKYKHHKNTNARLGVIIKIVDKFERDDNILVQWNEGRAWCVSESWVEVISESVELADEQLEQVCGGMSVDQFAVWRCGVVNENR